MSGRFGLHNTTLLWGLLSVAVPVIIHLWRRQRREVVDWGAMIFLDEAHEPPARHSFRLDERLLLAVRMGLLGLLVVALARPYWSSTATSPITRKVAPRATPRGKTHVLAIDRSASMDERHQGISSRSLALRWARLFVASMNSDDAVAIVDAGARGRVRIAPPTRDQNLLERALSDDQPIGGGPSDVTAALIEAFRILAETPDTPGDVIFLNDGQRFPWMPDETLRWDLARSLHGRLGSNVPTIWAISFGESTIRSDREDSASLGSLKMGHSPALAGRAIAVSSLVSNTGSRPITPTAQLFVDGHPQGTPARVGPIEPRGQTPISFTTTIASPGPHILSVKLLDDDISPGDDEAEGLVEVVGRFPVLIVDGKSSTEPLGGQADFLCIALEPKGRTQEDSDPSRSSPFRTRVVPVERFDGEVLDSPKDRPSVLVLAGVAELNAKAAAAVDRFVADGGGLFFALGDDTKPSFVAGREWFPGRLEDSIATAITRLDTTSFSGATMGRFLTSEDRATPLAQVEVFRHRRLVPDARAVVSAKLTSGDAWCVERAYGKGRILVLTTALDGRATTLPINPDFVPLSHEWILSLAQGNSKTVSTNLRPGEPWVIALDPPPPAEVKTLPLRMPGGKVVAVPLTRNDESDRSNAHAEVRIDNTDAPGVYRLGIDQARFALVDRDARESDPATLSDADRTHLSAGWPLVFSSADPGLMEQIRAAKSDAETSSSSYVEFWRYLILAALVGLCLESWLARRLAVS